MDPDCYRPTYHSLSKTYYSNKYKYSDPIPKPNKTNYQKQSPNKPQSTFKTPNRPSPSHQTMNQLAPRFQQRAIYSQYYRTDYESSWRANLLAASYRARNSNKKPLVKIINLGERPDPEGAPAMKSEELEVPKESVDYDRILNHDDCLYSDYGSDSDVSSDNEDVPVVADEHKGIPDSSWSTASLLTHAFNKTNSNKVTIMSYAVIGAELNSITKLHTSKTESDLSKLTKRTLRLTENIDNARKSLKDIALGLRSLKQDMKAKSKRGSGNRDKPLKHSSTSLQSQSDLKFSADDADKRLIKRASVGILDKASLPPYSDQLMNYCTVDRPHKGRPLKSSHCQSDPKFSMIRYMNLEVANKRSSSDDY